MTTQTEDIVIPMTEPSGGFYEFEPGMYDAIVQNIESVPNTYPDSRNDTQLQWTFEVPGYENEDGSTADKRGWCNPVWNPKAKLWKWAQAILGSVPGEGEPFRTSSLIGKPCRIVLNSDDGKIKLTDVLGPAKAGGKAAPKKPGLVARLQDGDVPAGTAVATDMGPCVLCGEPGTRFTGKGKPICDECA